jgi:hypothetical protein
MKLMDVYVKNGTPLEGPSLCQTCTQALIVRGYRESEEVVVCQATYPDRRVKFRVRECSRFIDQTRQTLREMQLIAWVLAPRGSKRRAGFLTSDESSAEEDEIELILDSD